MKVLRLLGAVLCAGWLTAGCGSASDVALDEVRSALDSGDYATAVTKGETAVANDPTNFELTLALSSAYAGRAGIEYLDLVEALSNVDNDDSAFSAIHNVFVDTVSATGIADVRLAITTLTGFGGTIVDAARYYDQLGTYQVIEAFSLSTLRAKPTATSTTTVTDITDADRANVQADFVAADNNLVLGGLDADNTIVETIRKNFCALKNLSTAEGFTVAELQDITECQLSANAANVSTFQSASVTSCADFDFTQCATTDTSL